jgi:AcrR family transcriptional regulator
MESRRPGRPRIKAAPAVLRAAADVLVESGYTGFTVDRVAARAGVGRATVYRRWPTKLDLVVALLRDLRDSFVLPDAGSLEADVRALFEGVADSATAGERVMAALASETFNDGELFQMLGDEFIAPRRAQLSVLFGRAAERGELREDVDITALVNMTWGFLWQRRFINGLGVDRAAVDGFLLVLLGGIRAAPGG